MGKSAWETSALITGIWAIIHLFIFFIIEQSAAAVIFTLSLIATLFFGCKASEAPAEEEEEEEEKESEAKNKEVKKVKDDIF